MHAHVLPRPGIIVFDVDGTLIDVSQSYREATPIATVRYLSLLGLQAPELGPDVFEPFKRMGGFNDDWDLVTGLLEILLADLPPALPLAGEQWDAPLALVADLQRAALPLASTRLTLPDLDALVDPARAAGGGLAGVRQVAGGRNSHLVRRGCGDMRRDDLVQRVFCEIYFGARRFHEAFDIPALFDAGEGFLARERLLISPETLAALGRHARLAIATGRTRAEARYGLAIGGLRDFFTVVTTYDDAREAGTPSGQSFLKPHPFLLERAADLIDPTRRLLAAYVGDNPDDIAAARQAGRTRRWLSVALTTALDRTDLRQHYLGLGADHVLAHPDELLTLWPDGDDIFR